MGPSPVDRARPGSKHHVIVDRHGTPLAVSVTGGNRHDVTQLIPLLDAIPPIRGLRGRPRSRPKRLFADRGYDFDSTAACCGSEGSSRRSRVAARHMDPGSARHAGWWSVPSPGSTNSNDYASATNAGPISTRGCWN